jgi:hypothetical protein
MAGAATANITAAKGRYGALKQAGAPRAAVRTAECDTCGAEATAELSKAAADGRLAEAIALGPWRFIAWPGEYFLELKSRLPGTFLITLANGELQGYVVNQEAEPQKVYESINAIFAPENGRRIIDATVSLAAHAG